MHRVGRHLAAERGITQFLDIGTGIPTSPNLHEVVQSVTPSARVVYVDKDPNVLAHARALLVGTAEGATAYVQADIGDPESILDSSELLDTLDLSRPVALTVLAVMHFVEDDEVAYSVMSRLVEALPSGSYLAMSVGTDDFEREKVHGVKDAYKAHGESLRLRTKAQIERFFDGLELTPPGVVQVHKWHAGPVRLGSLSDNDVGVYGGLAYKR